MPSSLHPLQNAMRSGVARRGDDNAGSQLTPDSSDGISTAYTLI